MPPAAADVRAAIFAALARRAPGATVCPSEVARALAPGPSDAWRPLMPLVREVARALAAGGELEVRQRGRAVAPGAAWRGPVRLARASPPGA